MARTRTGLLAAARVALAKYGVRKATMGDVATVAGVAKATVYNHFRTRGELVLALAENDVRVLIAELADRAQREGMVTALATAARELAEHPVVRRLGTDEPALLGALVLPRGPGQGVWTMARDLLAPQIATITGVDGATAGTDVVVRWLGGHLLWAGSPAETEAGARIVVGGLTPAPPVAPAPKSSTGYPTDDSTGYLTDDSTGYPTG